MGQVLSLAVLMDLTTMAGSWSASSEFRIPPSF
jgi:hypothetical protein